MPDMGRQIIFQLTGNFKISCYKLQNLQEEHLLQKFVIIHWNYRRGKLYQEHYSQVVPNINSSLSTFPE